MPSYFSSHDISSVSCFLFSATFLYFLLVISLMPKYCVEVLCCVPKCKAVMCLMENICVLDKLLSGMSYTAFGMTSMLMNQQYILNKVC